MSGLAKSLLATALTLPLVAFVVGVLAAPDAPEPDRSRPVIIGQVDNQVDDQVDDGDDARGEPRERRDRRDRRSDRDDDEDGPPGPGAVVTPAPRDLADDDDGVGDDDDDGDDETDETDDD